MFKKIAIGTLIAGLTGSLIAGAIIRTNNKAPSSHGEQAQGQGRNSQSAEVQADWGGGLQGAGDTGVSGSGYRAGQGGDNTGGQNASAEREPQAQSYDWVALEGAVTHVDSEMLVVTRISGEELIVEGRAWQFAQEQDFRTEPGNLVVLNGFYEDGAGLVTAEIVDLTNSNTVAMRDASGKPLWSGGKGQGGPQGA